MKQKLTTTTSNMITTTTFKNTAPYKPVIRHLTLPYVTLERWKVYLFAYLPSDKPRQSSPNKRLKRRSESDPMPIESSSSSSSSFWRKSATTTTTAIIITPAMFNRNLDSGVVHHGERRGGGVVQKKPLILVDFSYFHRRLFHFANRTESPVITRLY